MGEIANDMIEGACCALCGQYFVREVNKDGADVPVMHEHGYPVACKECWEPGCGYEKAEADTL
jgi:hypothetical protein